VVLTVPKGMWSDWLIEGDVPGDYPTGTEYAFYLGGHRPRIRPGERVYIVAHGKLRGYAPLVRIDSGPNGGFALIRAGGAVACTHPEPMRGFQGWRYRFWKREEEIPFPNWRQP
jgi:hypothetical protein